MAEGQVGERFQVLACQRAPTGVVRRVEHQQLCSLGDEGGHLVGVHSEFVLFSKRHSDRFGPGERGDRFVHREAGIRIEDFVALPTQRHDGEEHDGLGSGGDHDTVGRIAPSAGPAEELPDGLSHLGQARSCHIVGEPCSERVGCSIDDVRGRIEVGLADLQMDDLAPLRFQRPGPTKNFERGFCPKE